LNNEVIDFPNISGRKYNKFILMILKKLFKSELDRNWIEGYDSGFEDGYYK
jgi:hypothetical protein